ncbi:MAG: hypothetical protein WCW77_04755 [Patescibacteria group bacterium]|jgi:hypothetical protein
MLKKNFNLKFFFLIILLILAGGLLVQQRVWKGARADQSQYDGVHPYQSIGVYSNDLSLRLGTYLSLPEKSTCEGMIYFDKDGFIRMLNSFDCASAHIASAPEIALNYETNNCTGNAYVLTTLRVGKKISKNNNEFFIYDTDGKNKCVKIFSVKKKGVCEGSTGQKICMLLASPYMPLCGIDVKGGSCRLKLE